MGREFEEVQAGSLSQHPQTMTSPVRKPDRRRAGSVPSERTAGEEKPRREAREYERSRGAVRPRVAARALTPDGGLCLRAGPRGGSRERKEAGHRLSPGAGPRPRSSLRRCQPAAFRNHGLVPPALPPTMVVLPPPYEALFPPGVLGPERSPSAPARSQGRQPAQLWDFTLFY